MSHTDAASPLQLVQAVKRAFYPSELQENQVAHHSPAIVYCGHRKPGLTGERTNTLEILVQVLPAGVLQTLLRHQKVSPQTRGRPQAHPHASLKVMRFPQPKRSKPL
ncbi:hypothetical protein GWK47_003885 [Chionoecetes opilio]|uniref:Uncharacterized protein n=1 Tax=Chionoecetes opilio TaxID=41210 RepID=A0A8J5D0B6_CHIOP|nr:hypothetical protein GWK47_003885 [Chionoecetes opilio]